MTVEKKPFGDAENLHAKLTTPGGSIRRCVKWCPMGREQMPYWLQTGLAKKTLFLIRQGYNKRKLYGSYTCWVNKAKQEDDIFFFIERGYIVRTIISTFIIALVKSGTLNSDRTRLYH